MPSLVITQNTVSVRLQSQRLELVNRDPAGAANDFVRLTVPLYDVERVFILGRPMVTMAVFQKLLRAQIPVSFITGHGRWIGALTPESNPDAARRIRQYELYHDDIVKLAVASRLVYAKIRNSRRVLQRLAAARKQTEAPDHVKTSRLLAHLARFALGRSENLDRLRGYEGMAAAAYFKCLATYFPPNVPFFERSRQPPRDAANALLSWTYAIVQGEIDAVVRAHGLDPCIGFLHSIAHGMPSLVLDLLEPLRAPLGDMLTLHLLNHKILRPEHFEFRTEDGGTYLKAGARKDFFLAYEQTMTRKFSLRPGGGHVDFRKIILNEVLTTLAVLGGEKHYEFFLMP